MRRRSYESDADVALLQAFNAASIAGTKVLVTDVGANGLRGSDSSVDMFDEGGTILSTSRGGRDPAAMADYLREHAIDILFCIGGDGTQRGAHAIAEEAAKRGSARSR